MILNVVCILTEVKSVLWHSGKADAAEWYMSTTVQCSTAVTGGGFVLGQAQGGVFSFMAAASWAFCSLYSRIFRWRL